MNIDYIFNALKDQPSYRLNQVKKAIFSQCDDSWDKVTSLPASLREELANNSPLSIDGKLFVSSQGDSAKALLNLVDGFRIETVLMRHGSGRNTVCVSSQVGCPLGCLFCFTGKLGLKRSLTYSEIIEQVLFFNRYLHNFDNRVTNIVFMGMGEPMLNYNEIIKAIRLLNDKEAFNIGARKISISTVGVIEGIKKLSNENLQLNLAISLHAPNEELRSRIMPVNKKYHLIDVLDTVNKYIEKTKRRVMFEYIMLKGINDSEECAHELAGVLRQHLKTSLYFINIILYNDTDEFKPSEQRVIKKFETILENEGVPITQRYRFGEDIHAACGQLAATYQKGDFKH